MKEVSIVQCTGKDSWFIVLGGIILKPRFSTVYECFQWIMDNIHEHEFDTNCKLFMSKIGD